MAWPSFGPCLKPKRPGGPQMRAIAVPTLMSLNPNRWLLMWHNITRPEALAAQARAASGVSAQVAAIRPSQAAVTKGAASSTSRAAASHGGASVTASAACKPESRRNLKPTKPAIQISDADCKRKILITDKCTMAFKKWREKGESFRPGVDRYRCIEGRCLHQIMSAKTKVTKTKTALKQETYNLSGQPEP